jgi:hypothetical protein
MAHSLAKSNTYKSFVSARDRAAERLLSLTQKRISDKLRLGFSYAFHSIAAHYEAALGQGLNMQAQMHLKRIEQGIHQSLMRVQPLIVADIMRMRRLTTALALSSEAEAISRALNKPGKYSGEPIKDIMGRPSPAGGDWDARVNIYLHRVQADLMDALRQSVAAGEPKSTALQRCLRALPRKRIYPEQPRALRNITEAKQDKIVLATGTIADEDWDALVADYTDKFIPNWRGPESIVGKDASGQFIKGDDADVIYAWELERDVTQEFVQSVRDGQIAGANEQGIIDFVWIAIVDDKTDDCCLWRDGLTTKEIEAELQGAHKHDECDGTTPPIHWNCRCTLAPATDDMPDKPASNAKEFDEWLNNKGR